MRFVTIGVLFGTVWVGACNQAPSGTSDHPSDAATNLVPAGNATTSSTTSAEAAAPVAAGLSVSSAVPAADRVVWREVTIPAGTSLSLVLDTPVASDTSRVEEPVRAHLARAVTVGDVTALPEDSTVTGVVSDVARAGKVEGRAHLAIRFDTLVPRGQDAHYELNTSSVGRTAPSEKKKDAAKIAAPAVGGAIIGGIVGGKKGAVIGGAVGGGAGTAVVMNDRGQEVRLGKGAAITLKLSEPLTVRVRS